MLLSLSGRLWKALLPLVLRSFGVSSALTVLSLFQPDGIIVVRQVCPQPLSESMILYRRTSLPLLGAFTLPASSKDERSHDHGEEWAELCYVMTQNARSAGRVKGRTRLWLTRFLLPVIQDLWSSRLYLRGQARGHSLL